MMKKSILFIILSAVIFATMEVALKLAGSAIDPFQMTFLRFFIGGLILLPFGIAERHRLRTKLAPGLIGYSVLLGLICVPASMVLFQYGIVKSNAATSAVLFCVNPIFTAALAHFLNKGDRFTAAKGLALSVAAAGIVFMIRPWDIQAGNSLAGALMSIGAAALFSLYSVLGTRSLQRLGVFMQTALSFLFGSALLFVILILMGRPILAGVAENLPVVLYAGAVVTGMGYLAYFLAIRFSNATTGSVAFFLKPVLAPAFAVLILHETLTWNSFLGIALILVSSLIIIRSNAAKR